jgi:uncharacterized membrane protein
MSGMSGTILSLLMLAGLVLGAGGTYLIVRRGERKQGWLMIVAAAVMFGNVAIWAVPVG